MVEKKKVAKKKVAARAANTDRMIKLKAQIAELKAENRTLKAEGRQKDRQIAALLKALQSMEKKISRFVAAEQKALLKQYDVALKPRRRRRRKTQPAIET